MNPVNNSTRLDPRLRIASSSAIRLVVALSLTMMTFSCVTIVKAQLLGDVGRGEQLFATSRASCSTCHTVDGRGEKLGPDLRGVADKFDHDHLLRAVLQPSADILPGYETTEILTVDGRTSAGIVKAANEREIVLVQAEAGVTRVERSSIESLKTTALSSMPGNFGGIFTHAELDDLIAYLETLHLPVITADVRAENPSEIATASTLAHFEPLFPASVAPERPVWIAPLPGHAGQWVVADVDPARIWRYDGTGENTTRHTFLDVNDQTRHGYIEGILGVALHPDFIKNHRYFVAMHDPSRSSVIVNIWERRAADDGLTDSGQPPRKLLSITTPHVNHNGCCLEFGPDGMLYISMGDGGPQEDPNGYAQNLESLLGKVLRVDVDSPPNDLPYVIPPENPFCKTPGARAEIWAYGFREPWRFTFDRENGDIWLGDVGQGQFEEIDLVRAGENFGWNVIEGFHSFSDRYRRPDAAYVPPVLSYSHRHGVSVTGGYVYRGTRAPQLRGAYIFADYETRHVWALRQKDRKLVQLVEIGRAPSRVTAFGQDDKGELLLLRQDPPMVDRLVLDGVDLTPVAMRELVATSEHEPALWRTTTSRPAEGWQDPAFDDHTWAEQPGGFGTANTPGTRVHSNWNTSDIWLRRDFDLNVTPERSNASNFALRLHHDEDVEVYLNGQLLTHLSGFTTGYTDVPLDHDAAGALRPGRNTLAVHCHQTAGGQYIDVGLIEFVRQPKVSVSSTSVESAN